MVIIISFSKYCFSQRRNGAKREKLLVYYNPLCLLETKGIVLISDIIVF